MAHPTEPFRGRAVRTADWHIHPLPRSWNPTTTFVRSGAEDLVTTIRQVDGSTTYERTVTHNANCRITSIGPWVEV